MLKKFFLTLSIVPLVLPSTNEAQAAAFTTSPTVIDKGFVQPGSEFEEVLYFHHDAPGPVEVTLSTQDFLIGQDREKIYIDPQDPASLSGPSSWVQWPEKLITLEPDWNEIPIVVKVPASAAPGSYYTALQFNVDLAQQNQSLSNAISTIQRNEIILLLNVSGQVDDQLTLDSFITDKKWYEKAPVLFSSNLRNTGNIYQKTPIGRVKITNFFGQTTDEFEFNFEEERIYPQEVVQGQYEWPGRGWHLGPYTATLEVNHSSEGKLISLQAKYWMIPWKTLLLIALVFLTTTGVIIYRRKYKKTA